MSAHLSRDALEAYVIGALSEIECADVEAHVTVCEACAAALQHEARLELAFAAVATAAPPKRARRSVFAPVILPMLGGAFAMAAAVLLWMIPRDSADRQPTTAEQPPVVESTYADASTFTASLDTQADGSRVGVRD
jgi:hypothetical protein